MPVTFKVKGNMWLRLIISVCIGLILIVLDDTRGMIENTSYVGFIGIGFIVFGLLTVPVQWLVDWIRSIW